MASADEPLFSAKRLPLIAPARLDELIEMPSSESSKGGVFEKLGLAQFKSNGSFVPCREDKRPCVKELAAKVDFRQNVLSAVMGLDEDMYDEAPVAGRKRRFKDIALVVSRNRPHPVEAPNAEVAAAWRRENGDTFRLAVFRSDDLLDAFLCEDLDASQLANAVAAAAISRVAEALENGMQYVRRIYLYTASYADVDPGAPHLPHMFYDDTLKSDTFLHSVTCTLANQPLYANKIYIDGISSPDAWLGKSHKIPRYMDTFSVRLDAPYDRDDGEKEYYVSWFDMNTPRMSTLQDRLSKLYKSRVGRVHMLEDIAKISTTRGYGVYGYNSVWLDPPVMIVRDGREEDSPLDRHLQDLAAVDPDYSINLLSLQPIFRDMFPMIFPFQLFSARNVQSPHVHFLSLAAGLPDLQVPGAFLYTNPASGSRPPANLNAGTRMKLGLTGNTSAFALSAWRDFNVTSSSAFPMPLADQLRVSLLPKYGFIPRFYRLMQNSSGSINYFMRFLPRSMDVRDARGVYNVADPRSGHARRVLIYMSFIMGDYGDDDSSLTGSPSKFEIEQSILPSVPPVIDPQPPAEMEFVVTNLVQRFVHGIYNYMYLTRPWITITLYRGMIPTVALPAPKVEQEYTETGVMYVSPSSRRVQFYVKRGTAKKADQVGKGYVLEFANARVPCVYNYCDQAVYSRANYSEEEFALPPGTKYRVVAVRKENGIDVYSCEFTNLDIGWGQQSYVPSTDRTPEGIRFGNSLYFENQQVCELVNSGTNTALTNAFTRVDSFVDKIIRAARLNLDNVRSMHVFLRGLGTKYTGSVNNAVFSSEDGIYAHMTLSGRVSGTQAGWSKSELYKSPAPVYLLQNPAAQFFLGQEIPTSISRGFDKVVGDEAATAASGVMKQPLLRLAPDSAPPVMPGFGRRAKRARMDAAPVGRRHGVTIAGLDTFYPSQAADKAGRVLFATVRFERGMRMDMQELNTGTGFFNPKHWKSIVEALPIARALIVCKDDGMVDNSGDPCSDIQMVVQMYTAEAAESLGIDDPDEVYFDIAILDYFEKDIKEIAEFGVEDDMSVDVLEYHKLSDEHHSKSKGMSPFIYMLETFMEVRPGVSSKTGCSLGAGGWVIDYIANHHKPEVDRTEFVPRRRITQSKLKFKVRPRPQSGDAGAGLGASGQQSRRSSKKRQARTTQKAKSKTPRKVSKSVRKTSVKETGVRKMPEVIAGVNSLDPRIAMEEVYDEGSGLDFGDGEYELRLYYGDHPSHAEFLARAREAPREPGR